jgi:chaperonin GroEL (HSP60 family)
MSFLSKPATMPVACNAPLGTRWFGVGVEGPGDICGNMEAFVWEPPLVKLNAIDSATETACLILSVDETVRNQINKARQYVGSRLSLSKHRFNGIF